MKKNNMIPKPYILVFSRHTLAYTLLFTIFFTMIGIAVIIEKNSNYIAAIILFTIATLLFFWFIAHYKRLIITLKENIRVNAKVYKVFTLPTQRRLFRRSSSIILYYSFTYQDKKYVSHCAVQVDLMNIESYRQKEIIVLVNSRKPSFTFPIFWLDRILDYNAFFKSFFWWK